MRVPGVAIALLLAATLAPGASAWTAHWAQPVDAGLSVRTSLLLAGDVSATGRGLFAATGIERLDWGPAATVRVCPDRAGEPDPDCAASPANVLTGARLRVLAGGLVAQPLNPARVEASAAPASALLGGAGLSLNGLPTGPALFAAGPSRLAADVDALLLRPLGRDARIEVESDEGTRALEGAAYTLRATGLRRVEVECAGIALALRDGDEVALARSGPSRAEASLRLDGLFDLQRQVMPPEAPPRRAHLADAFGPFQVVPVLLDGAIAAHANATLGEAPQDEFLLVRVESARVRLHEDRWVGAGEASYLVQGDVVAASPGARVEPPLVAPLVLAGLALGARLLTPRETPAAWARRGAWALRALALPLLVLLADAFAAPLLGLHPLLDGGTLSARSRVQLGLLVGGMGVAAWLLVGASVESLARSAFALRRGPAALVVPILLGLVAAAAFLYLGHAPLLSLVARVVRL